MRVLIAVLVLVVAGFVLNAQVSAFPSDPRTGVTIIDTDKVEPGYVLYTPLRGDPSQGTATVTYLINVFGEVVHMWPQATGAGQYASLLPDGRLLYASQADKDIDVPAGDGGMLQIIDWDGNVQWSYENFYLHHDQEMLPDGNIAALIYSLVPDDLVSQIQGGLPGTELEDGAMWGDSIIEIDEDGNVVRWAIETGAPRGLRTPGGLKNMPQVDEEITVTLVAAKSGAPVGFCGANLGGGKIVRADGTVISSPGVGEDRLRP